jgi:hypothetical protein
MVGNLEAQYGPYGASILYVLPKRGNKRPAHCSIGCDSWTGIAYLVALTPRSARSVRISSIYSSSTLSQLKNFQRRCKVPSNLVLLHTCLWHWERIRSVHSGKYGAIEAIQTSEERILSSKAHIDAVSRCGIRTDSAVRTVPYAGRELGGRRRAREL